METVANINNTRTNPLRKVEAHQSTPQVEATLKERLHTVEEFIDKLEQAVLERL